MRLAWNRAARLCALLFALAFPVCTGGEPVRLLERPAYPLYTISSLKSALSGEDLDALARHFTLIHGKLDADQFDALRARNPAFTCLRYINSTYTRTPEHVGIVESRYRKALALHAAARLAADATPTDTVLRVSAWDPRDPRVPVHGSTVEGDFSSTDPERPSTRFFVSWVRIGDEWMRVNRVDAETGGLEVTRGWSGGTAVAHRAGAVVLAPVYLGFRRANNQKYPGQHPLGPGRHLRYVLDPGVPEGHPFIADQVVEAMTVDRADGVWLDTLNTGDFNLSDALGRPVRAWNVATGAPYTFDEFRAAQEKKFAFVQEDVHARVGRHPVLVGNNLKPSTYPPGRGGMRLLLESTAEKPRPLDGFCMEGGLAWDQNDLEPEHLAWKDRIAMLMDAAQRGLAAMPILASAGSDSPASEADTPARERMERFGYASYLLAVEANGRTRMGTYAFYQSGGRRFVKVHPMYFYPIGAPAETWPPDQLDRYRMADSPVYRRAFTGGVVLVNPSHETAVAVLDAILTDPDTGASVEQVTLPPGSGKILLAPAAGGDG